MENFDYDLYTAMNNFSTRFKPIEASEADLDRTQYIKDEIEQCWYNDKTKNDFIKKDSLIADALKNFWSIGCVPSFEQTFQIIKSIQFVENESFKPYHFEVLSSLTATGSEICKTAKCIVYPRYIDLTSKVFLCHEFAHILKERNIKEVANCYTTEEAIPIATELISAVQSENSNIARDIIRARLTMLKNTLAYSKSIEAELLVEENKVKKEALTTALKKGNCYFISFYYALILFELYLGYPDKIINLINAVLECVLTTDEILGLLNEKKYDKWADDGLQEFKKMLC